MSYFDKAIGPVLEHEGGYVNHPSDPGGETNYGICKRNYPNVDIKHLTRDEAIEIYRADYWRPYMEFMPEMVACKHFDQAVNMGHRQANKLLQRAVGCVDDGVIGPVTLAASKLLDPSETVRKMCEVQKEFYEMLATSRPSLACFLKGWNRRASWVPEQWNA